MFIVPLHCCQNLTSFTLDVQQWLRMDHTRGSGNWITLITQRSMWIHFAGLRTTFAKDFYDFLIRHFKKRKKSCFLKSEKNVKYVFSNSVRNWTIFAICYGWDVMSGNRSKSPFFEGRWITLSADFRGKGASPTNHCWCQKSRVIVVSCGITISAMHHLVLSQYTRLTERRTDGENCDSNRPTVRCITCSRTVKTKQPTKTLTM